MVPYMRFLVVITGSLTTQEMRISPSEAFEDNWDDKYSKFAKNGPKDNLRT